MEEKIPVIQEDNFTIKKLFDLLKRSAKRILVYAIIFATIGAGIAALVAVLTRGEETYNGIIDYNYKGVDSGLDPKGNLLETSRIKSSTVIYNALAAMGNLSEERINELVDILEDDIIIEGYVSDSMKDALKADPKLSFFPSRYTISVPANPKTKFSKHQYTDFVNKLMEQYIVYFSDYYDYGKLVTLLVNENTVASATDYINALNAYKMEVASLQAEINALPSTYNLIRNKLQARLNVLSMQVDEIYSYILKYNVQKEGAPMTLTEYFNKEEDYYKNQGTMYATKATELKAIIGEYKLFYEKITNANDTLSVVVADMKEYNDFIASYEATYAQQIYYETKENESKYARDNLLEDSFVATNQERASLNAKFESLYSSLTNELGGINEELSEYSKLNLFNNGVKISMNAARDASISYMVPIVIFAVILLIGIGAAIIVTQVKSSKPSKKTEKAIEDK